MKNLPIWVSTVEDHDSDTKAIFKPSADALLENVPVEKLKESLSEISSGLTDVLTSVKEVGKFRLQEVTIQVEVTASGGINLIGNASVGGKGAITLKFVE